MAELPLLPCLEPNEAPRPATLGAPGFAYLGTPLTLPEFVTYLASYDFGTIAPDQLVLHNTANPDASWAPIGTNTATWWDRDEAGLSPTAIRNKRQKQLDRVKLYYVSLGWDAGPHLFVDDRYIWLFTPMDTIGVHAKEGNSYRDAAGRLHYTLGIEVVGWYGRVGWPAAIQALLRGAVQALQHRLGTFKIVYKPAPAHHPELHQGSIAFHRDYNKPECPGAQITPMYAIPILGYEALPSIPDPLRAEELPGPNKSIVYCSEASAAFYVKKGGFSLFGYPLKDEFSALGSNGALCSLLVCERAVIKRPASPIEPVHLALLSEVKAKGWI